MELLQNLALGFETVLTPINLLYCFLGVFLGTLIGVLPGSARRRSAEPAPDGPSGLRAPVGALLEDVGRHPPPLVLVGLLVERVQLDQGRDL